MRREADDKLEPTEPRRHNYLGQEMRIPGFDIERRLRAVVALETPEPMDRTRT